MLEILVFTAVLHTAEIHTVVQSRYAEIVAARSCRRESGRRWPQPGLRRLRTEGKFGHTYPADGCSIPEDGDNPEEAEAQKRSAEVQLACAGPLAGPCIHAARQALRFAVRQLAKREAQRQANKKIRAAFIKQLQRDGIKSLRKSGKTVERNLRQHKDKLKKLRKRGGKTSSVEREIRTFERQLEEIKKIIKEYEKLGETASF